MISWTPLGPQELQSSVDQMRSDPEVTVRVCLTFWVSQRQSDELSTFTVKVSVLPTLGFLVFPVIVTVNWDPSQRRLAGDAEGDEERDADGERDADVDVLRLADSEAVGVSGPQTVSVHDGLGV